MQNEHAQKLGFIGLGLMGKPMCRNLIEAGYDLLVTNRSVQPRAELAEAGATALETPGQVAAKADAIIIMVADTAAVESPAWLRKIKSAHARDVVVNLGA